MNVFTSEVIYNLDRDTAMLPTFTSIYFSFVISNVQRRFFELNMKNSRVL